MTTSRALYPGRGLDQIGIMDLLKAAFRLAQADVACVGGWTGDGSGELDDSRLDALLERRIVERAAETHSPPAAVSEPTMVSPIPEGLRSLTPQLTVDGASEAIAFYERAFGAKELARAPDPTGKKIWHAEVRIGDSVFFINDAFPEMGGPANTSRLWIYQADIDSLFNRAVAAGCEVKLPLTDMFWGDRTGTLADKWGNVWSLGERTRNLTPEQMQKEQDQMTAKWRASKK